MTHSESLATEQQLPVTPTLDELTSVYGAWLRWQGLEEACALEHIAGSDLTPYQLKWLTDFVELWDRVEEAQ